MPSAFGYYCFFLFFPAPPVVADFCFRFPLVSLGVAFLVLALLNKVKVGKFVPSLSYKVSIIFRIFSGFLVYPP